MKNKESLNVEQLKLSLAPKTKESLFLAAAEEMITVAKLHRAKYDALIKEGFNESQALELCKRIVW